jgi:hypothetical protein
MPPIRDPAPSPARPGLPPLVWIPAVVVIVVALLAVFA